MIIIVHAAVLFLDCHLCHALIDLLILYINEVCMQYVCCCFILYSRVHKYEHTNVMYVYMQTVAWLCFNIPCTHWISICACLSFCVCAEVCESNIECMLIHNIKWMCFVMHTGTLSYKGLFCGVITLKL